MEAVQFVDVVLFVVVGFFFVFCFLSKMNSFIKKLRQRQNK